jgi:GGDEF domain-containing protein
MSYEQFERLVIGIGAIVVVGLVVVSARQGTNLAEVGGDILLLVVLASAVHAGRKAGFMAAVVASVIYIGLTIPAMAAQPGVTLDSLVSISLRVAAYGVIGILGGEIASRVRYVFARLENESAIDEWSGAYNQRYISAELARARGRYARYGEPFSAVLMTLAPAVTAELSPQRKRSLVRSVASYVRGDLRMVDEVARLEDGSFLMLLAHTPREGGRVVSERVAIGVRQLLGAREESVVARCYGAAEDTVALATLAFELAEAYESVDDEPSGLYSSAGANDLNPEAVSAVSAPGPSTLKMSTAAAPEGSTKQ